MSYFLLNARFCLLLRAMTTLTLVLAPALAQAIEWAPSDEDIAKYRKSWNPFSHGPILLQAVDIQPKGQLSIREFLFSQIGESSFGNQLSFASHSKNGPVHLYALSPSVNAAYGLTDHIELGAAASMNSFWARQNGRMTTDTGLGDTSLIVKYRPIVQDPDGWRPSITHFSQVILPTSRWITGTERPPGGVRSFGQAAEHALRRVGRDTRHHGSEESRTASYQQCGLLYLFGPWQRGNDDDLHR